MFAITSYMESGDKLLPPPICLEEKNYENGEADINTALRESEARYRCITESITDYIYTVRVADGKAVETHHGAGCIGVTGYSESEFANDPYLWFEIVCEEDQALVRQHAQRVLANENRPPLEHRIRRKDGEIRWIRNTTVRYHDSQGNLTAYEGLIQDITDRKSVEIALRNREEEYRTVVENTPDIIVRYDRKFRHLYVSPAITRFSGFSPKDLIGKTGRELGFPDNLCTHAEKCVQNVFESGIPCETELQFVTTQNREVIFDLRFCPQKDHAGHVTFVLGIWRDITEQKKIKTNYINVFNQMVNGFAHHEIICDDSGHPVDYRFLAVNPAFERLAGRTQEEIVGKTIKEILPNTESAWIEAYGRVALEQTPVQFEGFVAEYNRHFNVTAYSPAKGEFACIFEDVTEIKHAEEERQALQEQLMQAQKMEAVGLGWRSRARL
jgi:PAS domain S-box-containing protein